MRPTSYAAPRHRDGRARRGALVAGLLGLLAALFGLVLSPATSYAAGPEGSLCTDGGVNVVVDFQQLGGGVKQACDTSGADKTASQVFEDAGFKVTPVSTQPGFVCTVDGQPAQGGCAKMPPADAYWGLYVDKAGKWTYAPKGADELTMADGDFVAFSWQGTKTSTVPGVAPVRPTASASPSSPASPDASASSSSQDQQPSSGLAWWIPVLVVVLLVVAVAVVLVRRRGRPIE